MTAQILAVNATTLQSTSPSSLQPQFGPLAFGRQRRMSPHTVARNIAESIITHNQIGQHRPISFYTNDPDLQTLVQAKLNTIASSVHEAQQPGSPDGCVSA